MTGLDCCEVSLTSRLFYETLLCTSGPFFISVSISGFLYLYWPRNCWVTPWKSLLIGEKYLCICRVMDFFLKKSASSMQTVCNTLFEILENSSSQPIHILGLCGRGVMLCDVCQSDVKLADDSFFSFFRTKCLP